MYYKFLIAGLLVAMTSMVSAEPKKRQVTAICGTVEEIKEIIDSYEEKPLFFASSERFANVKGIVVLTVNPKTGSWTVVELNENGVNCILQTGETSEIDFELFKQLDKTV